MYICICNAVKESDIRDAVGTGVSCFKTLSKSLSLCTDCGSCGKKAKQAFHRALAESGASSNVISIDAMSTAPVRRVKSTIKVSASPTHHQKCIQTIL